MSLRRWVLMLIGFVGLIAVSSHPARTVERDVGIVVTEIKGPIGIAATRLITDALAKARHDNARLLVIQLDTLGGLVTATRDIIQQILAAPLPVIGRSHADRPRLPWI